MAAGQSTKRQAIVNESTTAKQRTDELPPSRCMLTTSSLIEITNRKCKGDKMGKT